MTSTQKVFYRDIIQHGLTDLAKLDTVYPLGVQVPEERLKKWMDDLMKPPTLLRPPKVWKFVNHFKLGADPEFVFVSPATQGPVPANSLNLKTGRAYGADQNGRLVEIRPAPNRSAIRVLASVMSTIRWLAIMVPQVRTLEWVAGAYQFDDGLGGHVHFGRKSPKEGTERRASFEDEVRALDNISTYLTELGVYPKAECARRIRGDARGQLYGRPGDTRPQAYGYEYRTFPSWLDNPWLAYYNIVMAKLAVCEPGIVKRFQADKHMEVRLKQLLAYFKDEDDDAAIAYLALMRAGLPKHYGGDFKGRWGATYTRTTKAETEVIPLCIEPSDDEVEELFGHLVHGEPLEVGVPAPTWDFPKPPAGFYMVLDNTVTDRLRGMGEMLWDICAPLDYRKTLTVKSAERDLSDAALHVSSALVDAFPADWRGRLRAIRADFRVAVENNPGHFVKVSANWREPRRMKRIRQALTCGILPLWRVSDNPAERYREYQQAHREVKAPAPATHTLFSHDMAGIFN